MAVESGDTYWDQFVDIMAAAGPVHERRSRYGGKPALLTERREIAHLEAPGVIDLRITREGWTKVGADFAADPAVHRDRSLRDWIELHLCSAADLDRVHALLMTALTAKHERAGESPCRPVLPRLR
jgi:hypothetical protein